MSNKRIHRYILKELCSPAILSLLIFTFVLLMGRIPKLTELVISKGVPAIEIAELFSYLLPTFFTITLPLAFLLGILLAFGRFSADSEFIAMKASGISLYRLLPPVMTIAVLLCLLTAWFTISLEPTGKTAFRNKIFQIASSQASVGIRPGVFNDGFAGLVLYARAMDNRQGIMKGVFISDEREGETPATIVARQGRFIPNPENYSLTLRLTDGNIHRKPIKEKKATYQLIGFNNYDVNIELGSQTTSDKRRHRSSGELSWQELTSAAEKTKTESRKLKLITEKHKRVSIAFAPLVFALVGVPLGLQSNRSGKGAGFALALGVSICYYLLLSISSTISEKSLFPAAISLWLPNIIFLAGGGYFLHRAAIEKPLSLFSWPRRIIKVLGSLFSSKEKR